MALRKECERAIFCSDDSGVTPVVHGERGQSESEARREITLVGKAREGTEEKRQQSRSVAKKTLTRASHCSKMRGRNASQH
jgi:hypothetical protein